MISAESMEELLVKVQTWKTEMEKKGLGVNMGKTKIMESGINLDVLKKSGKYPCGVCQSGVGSSNAIFCGGCKRWVHKKCSGIKGALRPDPEFRCARCLGTARAIDEREVSEVEVGNEKLEVVPEFCYLGDMLSAGGGCELAAITRCKCAWGKSLLTNRYLPLLTRGKVYSSCVRSVMLHAAETWAMKVDTLNRLRRNDRAMIRWICNVRAKDLDVVLRTSRMRWFGHVERSTGWIAEVRKLNVVAQKRSGRPRKSWDEVLENDKEARYEFCWPSESFWVERTPSRKTCQKAQPSDRGKQGSKMDMMMMMMMMKTWFNSFLTSFCNWTNFWFCRLAFFFLLRFYVYSLKQTVIQHPEPLMVSQLVLSTHVFLLSNRH